MKKLISVLAASVLALTLLSGCGAKEEKAETKAPEETASEVLVMATHATFPPYEFYENEKIVGIDAEIAEKIAEKLGMELKIEDTEFSSIIAGVQTGKYDIGMAGMTVTEERLQNVNFSESYAKGIQAVIVKEDSEIKSIDDLEGKKIGVQQDTTGHIYAADDYGDDFVTPFSRGADAVAALVAGKVDCVITDNEPAKAYIASNEGLKLLDTEYTSEDYAIAVSKDDQELLDKINKALAELTEDGTVDEIIGKYIGVQ